MRNVFQRIGIAATILWLAVAASASSVSAANSLTWNTNENIVSADIESVPLLRLLEGVAQLTGWQVYVESNASHTVSAKFKDLPPGEAVPKLLGKLNFALVPPRPPETRTRFYVFRSARENATQLVKPGDLNPAEADLARTIPNELIIRVKPGTDIEELARRLGAKIVGRIDELGIYRLQFDDEESTRAARGQLASEPEVASVDNNYVVNRPPAPMSLGGSGMPPLDLKFNPDASGRLVVALIDTAVQPTGTELDKFLTKSVSLAGEADLAANTPSHGTSMFQALLRGASEAAKGNASFEVVNLDIYGMSPSTDTFKVAEALVEAMKYSPSIINLSLGSYGDPQFLRDISSQITQHGVPMFAAAGNDGSAQPFYPAAYPELTAVTAGKNPGELASFANYGNFVDLMGPGGGAVSFKGTDYMIAGTSFATAYISGTVAGMAYANKVSTSQAAGMVSTMPVFQFPKR